MFCFSEEIVRQREKFEKKGLAKMSLAQTSWSQTYLKIKWPKNHCPKCKIAKKLCFTYILTLKPFFWVLGEHHLGSKIPFKSLTYLLARQTSSIDWAGETGLETSFVGCSSKETVALCPAW